MLGHVFSGLLLLVGAAQAVPRTEAPDGALIIAESGGDFASLQEAIDSIDKTSTDTTVIFIEPGTYTGQTTIEGYEGKIIIYGSTEDDQEYSQNRVVLTNSLPSSQAGSNERSGTLRVKSPGVSVYNILIENTAGDAGPAHALSVTADQTAFYGCGFTGWQDTFFGDNTNTVVKNSYIEGAVDYIYGGQNCNFWFENCDIGFSRATGGYITASGRVSDDAAWYVINNSRVFAKEGVSVRAGTVWLGRPWRDHARTVYQNTELSDIIRPEGWNPWDKGEDLSNIFYAEYGNMGDGADTSSRVPWSIQLDCPVSIDHIMPGWTEWVDQEYWSGSA